MTCHVMTRNESSDQETPRAAPGLQATEGLRIRQGGGGGAGPTSRQRASGYRSDCLAGIRRNIRFPAKARRLRPIIVRRRFRLIRFHRRMTSIIPRGRGFCGPIIRNV